MRIFQRSEPQTRVAYFVPLARAELPNPQAIMMESMKAPKGHRSRISPNHALLSSDIRFGIWLVTRRRNRRLFESLFPDPRIVAAAKVEFCDNAAAYEPRILLFVPTVAETIARLSRAERVVDVVTGRAFTLDEFSCALDAATEGSMGPLHLVESRSGWAGLRKVGQGILIADASLDSNVAAAIANQILLGVKPSELTSVVVDGQQIRVEVQQKHGNLHAQMASNV